MSVANQTCETTEERRTSVTCKGKKKERDRYAQKRHPLAILKQRVQQRPVSQPIFQEGKPDIPRDGEDDGAGEPDLERVDEEAVDGRAPAEEEVVHEGEGEAGCDAVCV